MCQNTFAKRKGDVPALAEALKRGKRAARGTIENVAFACAKKALEDPRYQASMIFWLKAKAGWQETQVIEHEGEISFGHIRDRLAERLARRAGVGDGFLTWWPRSATTRPSFFYTTGISGYVRSSGCLASRTSARRGRGPRLYATLRGGG